MFTPDISGQRVLETVNMTLPDREKITIHHLFLPIKRQLRDEPATTPSLRLVRSMTNTLHSATAYQVSLCYTTTLDHGFFC